MIRFIAICFLLATICLSCESQYHTPKTKFIDSGWSFKSMNNGQWRDAAVPGNVYSDLLAHNQISNPYMAKNELDVQWVAENDWEYKTSFVVDDSTLVKKHIELNFDGLDTYASVLLNDSLILQTDNAFRNYKVDVKRLIQKNNDLHIIFKSTDFFEKNEKSKLKYELPEGPRVFVRKPQFQFGWDWAPRLKSSGIWKPISLTSWNDIKIKDVYLVQNSIENKLAKLTAQIDIGSTIDRELTFEIVVNDDVVARTKMMVDSATTRYNVPFEIEDPKLWWPHNLGDPYLYNIGIRIKKGWAVLDYKGLSKGLRTIELVTEKDSIGESFYFKVNGEPIYIKGANYVPQNILLDKVEDHQYNKLLDNVVEANMNMLRVWGGGIYENEIFYDLCDQKGILVWQDFMFACAMYPGDKAFLDNVAQEAVDNVKRLRNHASIALWCGNNEGSEGWENWHWKDGKSKAQQAEIWNNYIKLFNNILPNTVREMTDGTAYWETSPKFGRGNPKYRTEGDAHDWFVWHDAYPFEHFEENVPRFMSEFGLQSFPSYETVKYASENDGSQMDSLAFSKHQKQAEGNVRIDNYMQRDFPRPISFEDYIYMSQLAQAYGVTKGIEAHRRAKPRNMGSMFWQLNDCWPAVSWSSIDFLGNWKALHYQSKKAFRNVLMSSKIENDTLKTYLINDEMKLQSGSISLRFLDFKGNEVLSICDTTIAQPLSSEIKYQLPIKSMKFDHNSTVLEMSFNNSTNYFYFVRPKELALETADIQRNITSSEKGFSIELSSTTLQKDVFLSTDTKGHFSDNFFDLMPNEKKIIEFKTNVWNLDDLNISTLNDFMKPTRPKEPIVKESDRTL